MPENLYLPPGISAVPGRFSFAARPYWARFVDFFDEPGRELICAVASSQSAKSMTIAGLSGWGADTHAGQVLWLRETSDRAVEYATDKLVPIYMASPRLARLLRQGRDAFTKDGLRFDHGALRLDGAGSKTAAQGRDPWLAIVDEYDKCVSQNRNLGDLAGRMLKRILTHRGTGRVALLSTPTDEDKGVWPIWEASQQWLWIVPCAECGARHPLEFAHQVDSETGDVVGGIKWPRLEDGSHPDPDRLLASRMAYYECPACLHRTSEEGKSGLVLSGSLENQTPDRPGNWTAMRLSGLNSPDYTWSAIASEFLKAKGKPAKMVVFRTETLALPNERKGSRPITLDSITALRDSFSWGTDGPRILPPIPARVQHLYAGVDAQRVDFWMVLLGQGYEGESWVLWAGRVGSKSDLMALEHTQWTREDGVPLWLDAAGLDCRDGNRTDELYRFVAGSSRFRALMGSRTVKTPVKHSKQDFKDPHTNQVFDGAVNLTTWHTTHFQDILQGQIDRGPGQGAGALHLPADVSREYIEHLKSERRQEILIDGVPTEVWKPLTDATPNHMRDAHCMGLVVAALDGWGFMPNPHDDPELHKAYLAAVSGETMRSA
jgi:phage terminase large subunit GpA-like protein